MGLSTAFLTGFVSAANKSMYETRMAAHEESVEARKDFQWRQRRDEEDAREDELLADSITLENQRLEASQTHDAQLLVNETAADRTEDDRLAAERAPIIAELHPEFTPEQVNMWARQSETTFNDLISRGHAGETWLAAENRFTNQIEIKMKDASILVDMMRPSGMAEGVLIGTPWGRMLQQNFLQGYNTEFLEQQGYTPNYIRDENGVIIGAEVVYADPDMYEPSEAERVRLDTAFATSINALNQAMSNLLLDGAGNILAGDAAIAVNILRQRALKEYGRIRSMGQLVDESYLVNRVFKQFEALMPALAGDNKQRADNLINDTVYVDTIANMSGEELFLIHQNLRDRIELSNNAIITIGSPIDTTRMQAVGDAIEASEVFIAYIRELEGEPVSAGAIVPPPLTGNPTLDARNLREVEEAQQRAVVEAGRIVTRTNNVVDRLTGEVNAQTENITRQQERGAGDIALKPLFQQLERAQNKLNDALAAQKEAEAAREALSPPVVE
jgi:hypothetical protein